MGVLIKTPNTFSLSQCHHLFTPTLLNCCSLLTLVRDGCCGGLCCVCTPLSRIIKITHFQHKIPHRPPPPSPATPSTRGHGMFAGGRTPTGYGGRDEDVDWIGCWLFFFWCSTRSFTSPALGSPPDTTRLELRKCIPRRRFFIDEK